MLRYVEKPNLPEGRVRLVLIGDDYIDRLNLSQYDIKTVGIRSSKALDQPISSHIDMQATHLYSNVVFLEPTISCKDKLLYTTHSVNEPYEVIKLYEQMLQVQGGSITDNTYPNCAAYNVLIINKFVFYNPKSADKKLIILLRDKYCMIEVRQGFSRCAVCVVNSNSVITSDMGMNKVLSSCGFDVLQITPGFISLPGYNYGFIGGTAFKLSKNLLAFTGRLDGHPDKNLILNFLMAKGVEPVWLSEERIFDIGSAIPLIEEVNKDMPNYTK